MKNSTTGVSPVNSSKMERTKKECHSASRKIENPYEESQNRGRDGGGDGGRDGGRDGVCDGGQSIISAWPMIEMEDEEVSAAVAVSAPIGTAVPASAGTAVPAALKAQSWIETEEDRNQLILDHLPMIKFIATRIANRLPPNVQTEDLVEAGIIGLLDAIEKFDASKDVKFKTYAEFRIRGAILDELRAQDWTPRSIHQKVKRVEKAYIDVEQKKGRAATDEEIAAEMNISLDKYHKLINQVRNVSIISLEDLTKILPIDEKDNILECLKSAQDETIYEKVNLKQVKDLLAKAINELNTKDQMILSLYYWDELTMKEIGSILGLAESTISERHTKAMISLKQKLYEVAL